MAVGEPHPAFVIPFILLLLCIAVAPFVIGNFWGKHYHHVAFLLGLSVIIYYLAALHGGPRLFETAADYIGFIALIGSLFTIAGGIHIDLFMRGSPLVSACVLGVGAITANFVGTTGASMLLIRPFMRINKGQLREYHAIFFIFIVSNVGGVLTPLGDPPLFLGYLKGVPFFWLMQQWQIWCAWLLVVIYLLVLFFLFDRYFSRKYPINNSGEVELGQIDESSDSTALVGASGDTETTLGHGTGENDAITTANATTTSTNGYTTKPSNDPPTYVATEADSKNNDADDEECEGAEAGCLVGHHVHHHAQHHHAHGDPLVQSSDSSTAVPSSMANSNSELLLHHSSASTSVLPPNRTYVSKEHRGTLSYAGIGVLRGALNFLWLGLIVFLVLIQEADFVRSAENTDWAKNMGDALGWSNEKAGDIVVTLIIAGCMLLVAFASYHFGSTDAMEANEFSFHPLKEVVYLFFGIFATMIPALDLLELHAKDIGFSTPLQFYWGSGALSSVLDNAPTYLNFMTAAMGAEGLSLENQKQVVMFTTMPQFIPFVIAVSLGSVFFGANTYIGNGPNMMVKSIMEAGNAPCPSFFKYIYMYTLPILMPALVVIGFAFVR